MNISAIVPVKNGEKYLINSFNHSIKNLRKSDELIYIDDNSTDNSWRVLKKISEHYSNVTVIRNRGMGIVDALNYGISKAKNEWIARFDIDDLYPKNRIELQRALINPQTAAIFCDYIFIDEGNNFLGQVLSPVFNSSTTRSLINSQRTPHPGVLFSKIIYLKAGGYKKKDFPVEDIALWWRMSKFGNLVSVPRVLLYYRIHQNSTTAINRQKVKLKRFEVTKRYFELRDLSTRNLFKNEYKNYKLFADFHERQVLAVRDYFTFLLHANLKNKLALHLFIYGPKVMLNPKKIIVIFRLLKEKIRRHNYKLTYFNSE